MLQHIFLIVALFSFAASVAAFTPSALPTALDRNPNPIRYGVTYPSAVFQGSTTLHSKKKGGGVANSPAKGKIQVKLLKHVAGTGQAGEVVMVTPAFLNNKLRPTKSAEIISDDQVAKEIQEAQVEEEETTSKAKELQEQISDLTLNLSRKAGPDGQLFGGINAKAVVAELENVVKDGFLKQKGVKLSEIIDENGKKMRGDIKHTGEFSARISLTKNISAKFTIQVQAGDE